MKADAGRSREPETGVFSSLVLCCGVLASQENYADVY